MARCLDPCHFQIMWCTLVASPLYSRESGQCTSSKCCRNICRVREFGGYDSVFIRTAIHATRDIFNTSSDDLNLSYEHNCLAVMYALQAVLPPLIEGGRPGGGADQCHRGKTPPGRRRISPWPCWTAITCIPPETSSQSREALTTPVCSAQYDSGNSWANEAIGALRVPRLPLTGPQQGTWGATR